MLLYLSSQKFGNNISVLKEWILKHNNKILLIFNALDAKSKEKIDNNVQEDIKLLEEIGFDVEVVDLRGYFGYAEKLKNDFIKYNAYCIMGGNVFILRQAMKYSGLDIFLQDVSHNKDYLYIGYSAGSCVLSNDLKLLDMVDEPINFYGNNNAIYEGLGLIDYIFIPHYKSNYHKSHLIDEIVQVCEKENIKFKAVKDGEVIIISNSSKM